MSKGAAAVWADLEELIPWVKNPKDNDEFIVPIAKSICILGWGAPFVAWKDAPEARYVGGVYQPAGNRIAAGHLRQKAIRHVVAVGPSFLEQIERELGRKPLVTLVPRKAKGKKEPVGWNFQLPDAPKPGLVPVRYMAFPSEPEYEAMVIRDNGEAGKWVQDQLPSILASIASSKAYQVADLGLGLSDTDLAQLTAMGQAEVARLSGVVDAAVADAAAVAATVPPDGAAPSGPPSAGDGGKAPRTTVLHYDIIWDSVDQQKGWFDVLRHVNKRYAEHGSIGARLTAFLADVLPESARGK
ncbi:MAG: hypothetical protein EKK55_01785 [Rhodocyclaceae bacterium]|nr:MAG: hypothetical protein EKK55_01785 [Rhodocyclaceae bacterium]